MVRWVSKSNNDSLFGGIDSINGGKFKAGHDNLQQFNLTPGRTASMKQERS